MASSPTGVASQDQGAATQLCNMNYVPTLSKKEISYILRHNRGVYRNKQELLAEWNEAMDNEGGVHAEFKSVDTAALYWAKSYEDDSVVSGNELASFIFVADYKDANGRIEKTTYFYNEPLEGTVEYDANNEPIRRKSCANKLSGCSDELVEELDIRIVSEIHSHGNGDPYFDFKNPSDTDKRCVADNNRDYESYIGKEYVATAEGCLKIFNENGLIQNGTVSDELFRDLRQNLNEPSLENLPERIAFDFYKKINYHPDIFMAYGTYPINN